MSKPLNIALVGFGNIGSGVVRHLQEHGAMINDRLERALTLKTICDRDLTTDRGVSTDGIELVDDFQKVLADPQIDVVIELVGGTTIARKIVDGALRAGKHVVTANKALISTFGAELIDAGQQTGARLLFEASVGAGIPIFRALQTGLLANEFSSLHGILNGTCNYILSYMEDHDGVAFEKVLKDAMDLGYAEPDPTLDIEGDDTAHKISILASLAFGMDLRFEHVQKRGITRISAEDVHYGKSNGWTVKLLASAERGEDGVSLAVRPAFVPRESLVGGVRGVLNCLLVNAQPIGPTLYVGAGAGQGSTSSGVLSDLILIAQSDSPEAIDRLNPLKSAPDQRQLCAGESIAPRTYYRCAAKDGFSPEGAPAGVEWVSTNGASVSFILPESDSKDRKEMLVALKGIGLNFDGNSEIPFISLS